MNEDKVNKAPIQILNKANNYFIGAYPDVRVVTVDLSKSKLCEKILHFNLTNEHEIKRTVQNMKIRNQLGLM